jgi:hypothetical protein
MAFRFQVFFMLYVSAEAATLHRDAQDVDEDNVRPHPRRAGRRQRMDADETGTGWFHGRHKKDAGKCPPPGVEGKPYKIGFFTGETKFYIKKMQITSMTESMMQCSSAIFKELSDSEEHQKLKDHGWTHTNTVQWLNKDGEMETDVSCLFADHEKGGFVGGICDIPRVFLGISGLIFHTVDHGNGRKHVFLGGGSADVVTENGCSTGDSLLRSGSGIASTSWEPDPDDESFTESLKSLGFDPEVLLDVDHTAKLCGY